MKLKTWILTAVLISLTGCSLFRVIPEEPPKITEGALYSDVAPCLPPARPEAEATREAVEADVPFAEWVINHFKLSQKYGCVK